MIREPLTGFTQILRKFFKILIIFLIGGIGGIFADQIILPYLLKRPLFFQYQQRPVYLTEKKEIIIQENVALTKGVEKVEKVVVGLQTKTKAGGILEGSGLIVSSDGLLVTLAELLPLGSTVEFSLDGKIVKGQILKRDLKENLVLVKLQESNLPTTGFAPLEKRRLGERVFLVGVIFEKGFSKKSVNEGIIKSFDENFIKTNISERKELRGSPLFDIEGNVLGLNIIDKEGKISALSVKKIREFIGF